VTNNALNIATAQQINGWQVNPANPAGDTYLHEHNGMLRIMVKVADNGYGWSAEHWNPAEDLNQAMSLVRQLAFQRGGTFIGLHSDPTGLCYAWVINLGVSDIEGEADTEARALCMAALALKSSLG
jgi:hypothetical protein